MGEAKVGCLFGEARKRLGFSAQAWRLFLLDWGGVESEAEFASDAECDRRAARRVADRLYVGGYRDAAMSLVGADYIAMIFRLRSECGLDYREFSAVAASAGHPAGWPILSLSGATFQGLVRYFRARGKSAPELGRSYMTPDRLLYLDELRSAWKVRPDRMPAILRDHGGGVFRPEDLDEAGLDRMEVFFEAKAGKAAARAPRSGGQLDADPIRRFWPDWRRVGA